jgi:lipoprotein NlpD
MWCDQFMFKWSRKVRSCGALMPLVVALLLAACASPRIPAPVEDRNAATRPTPPAPAAVPQPAAPAPESAKTLNSENAGKPGFYVVKPGDTMIRIGLETGQNWKDLVKWNNLDNPNVIEAGQVLRVVPPGSDTGVSTRPIAPPKIETRPLDTRSAASGASAPAAPVAPASAASSTAPILVPRDADDDIAWQWPAIGALLTSFEEGKAKGLTIGGKAGDPVMAAAEGRVVYAGSGLRGYGNLVILKHNNTYLTAYAHNQVLIVKEDQNVRRGQKIAEMGSSDADRVQLHFEIRRQGKPIDPARLLPPR